MPHFASMSPETLQLLAGLAHELRTPLSAIAGHAALLTHGVHGPLSPAQLESVERMRRNQDEMLSLIDSFMRYADAAAGSVRVTMTSVNIMDVLRDAVEQASDAAAGIVIADVAHGTMAARRPIIVQADASVLRQALDLVLRDAVVHARGTPDVRVDIEVEDGVVRVYVASDGAPFPSSPSAPSPLVPFDRGSDGARAHVRGDPFMLPTARALIRAVGGALVAMPETGRRVLCLELVHDANVEADVG